MNEWLPLVASPVVLALGLRQRGVVRAVHADLRTVIAAQPTRPVTDAGGAPVLAVARALELDPVDQELAAAPRPPRRSARGAGWEAQELIRPLGLKLVDVVQVEPRAFAPGLVPRGRTEMVGTRHGRHVVVRLEESSSLVHVSGELASFSLRAQGSRWSGLDDAPPVVATWLSGLEPSLRWDGVVVRSGADGLALIREEECTRSWMHDLWLAEQLADAARRRIPARC